MKVYKYHFTPTIALAAIIITTLVANVNAGTLTLQVEENNEFTILHDTNPWLSGGKFVQVGQYSTKDGTLVQVGTHNNTIGADKLGHYSAISIDYAKSEDPETVTLQVEESNEFIILHDTNPWLSGGKLKRWILIERGMWKKEYEQYESRRLRDIICVVILLVFIRLSLSLKLYNGPLYK